MFPNIFVFSETQKALKIRSRFRKTAILLSGVTKVITTDKKTSHFEAVGMLFYPTVVQIFHTKPQEWTSWWHMERSQRDLPSGDRKNPVYCKPCVLVGICGGEYFLLCVEGQLKWIKTILSTIIKICNNS